MRRLTLITLTLLLVALPWVGSHTAAQDDARDRVLRAYQDYATWDTYRVDVGGQSDYALTAQGARDAVWQKQSRVLVLSGWFDQSTPDDPQALLTLSKHTESTTSASGGEQVQAVEMDLALVNGEMFWRGTYTAEPGDGFALPAEWTVFTRSDAQEPGGLRDLPLPRFLMQETVDPLVPDYETWLDAAESISGPRDFTLSRTQRGDLYTVSFPLSAAPEMLEGRFTEVVAGADLIADPALITEALTENATVVWGVVVDPQSGRLLAQFTQLDLTTSLNSEGLQDPYSTLSLVYSDELNVLFSGVNEAVDTGALPEPE